MRLNYLQSRKGAATVEFAICLPLIVLIIVAGLDVHRILRLKQDVVEVTHETARVTATNEVDEHQARQFALDLLKQKNLANPTVAFDPVPSSDLPRGTPITVSISIPVAGNRTLISRLFTSHFLVSRSTVSREIGDIPLLPESDD